MEVDAKEWLVIVYPDGNYYVLGPVLGGSGFGEFARGRLGYGFALPGIERAVSQIIREQLKKEINGDQKKYNGG
jgi:hypothetical protein